jgi:molecular chaperone IbpA
MRHVDFSPLYRSTVGFDRLLTMLDSLAQPEQTQSYPPYNIERTGETTYRITMAVAGFDEVRNLDRGPRARPHRQGREGR